MNLDLLLQDTGETTTGRWAAVTQASPLRVKVDGDASALGFTPDSLVAGLAVADRVWVQVLNRRLVVIGKSGGLPDGGVATAMLAADAVTNAKLANMADSTIKGRAAGAGTGDPTDLTAAQVRTILDIGSWATWSPTNSNITVGSGTVTARYTQIGKTVHFLWRFVLGSGSAVASSPTFTLPVAQASGFTTQFTHIGVATLIDAGTGHYAGAARLNSSTTCEIVVFTAGGTYVTVAAVTSAVPFTFTSTDSIIVIGTYEGA